MQGIRKWKHAITSAGRPLTRLATSRREESIVQESRRRAQQQHVVMLNANRTMTIVNQMPSGMPPRSIMSSDWLVVGPPARASTIGAAMLSTVWPTALEISLTDLMFIVLTTASALATSGMTIRTSTMMLPGRTVSMICDASTPGSMLARPSRKSA